jgi:hypothetical protein
MRLLSRGRLLLALSLLTSVASACAECAISLKVFSTRPLAFFIWSYTAGRRAGFISF